MIKNTNSWRKNLTAFIMAVVINAAIFAFLATESYDSKLLNLFNNKLRQPLKIDQIDIIHPDDVEKFRKVGIKNGKKDANRPDIIPKPQVAPTQKGFQSPLSLESLSPNFNKPEEQAQKERSQNSLARNFLPTNDKSEGGHFYFDYKNQKTIPRSQEQEILKTEASKSFNAPRNKATDKISNFEIRYERPEGVSEDELNSDEKAYYSFYVRSYKNYYAKIYANYEKIVIERPGLAKVFDKKHLLIGKIDYDEEGNIITVRILKSSDSDDLHYFFEETLKQLNQPNPPKVFTRNKKQFSIFYQIQIN